VGDPPQEPAINSAAASRARRMPTLYSPHAGLHRHSVG
jgi:hypothetical protein